MDVNEEIVTIYLKRIKKWFYITDIPYKVEGKKGGSNYGNIDVLATDFQNIYDIEVKYRSAYHGSEDDLKRLKEQISNKNRIKKIKEFRQMNGKIKIKRIIVTTKEYLGKKETNKKEKFIKENLKSNVHFWYFDEIIKELYNDIEEKGRYNTQLEQIIRELKRLKLYK